jgi:tRNA (guanine-N7-)-methyltransferase
MNKSMQICFKPRHCTALARVKLRLHVIRSFASQSSAQPYIPQLINDRNRFTQTESSLFNDSIPKDAKKLFSPYLQISKSPELAVTDKFIRFPVKMSGLIMGKIFGKEEIKFPPNNSHQLDINYWFEQNDSTVKLISPDAEAMCSDDKSSSNSTSNKPVHMELGSGYGEWISKKATRNPHVNYIAVELDRIRSLYTLGTYLSLKNNINSNTAAAINRNSAGSSNASNLRVISGDAKLLFAHYLPVNSLDAVYLNFPEVWTKKKHFGRHIIEGHFPELLHKAMKSTATLNILTDHLGLQQRMHENLMNCGLFAAKFNEAPYFSTELPRDYGLSVYGAIWLSRNLPLHFAQYTKK